MHAARPPRFPGLRALARRAAPPALCACLFLGVSAASDVPARADPVDANRQMGEKLFDDCVRWVSRGTEGVKRTSDFFLHVTAELELEQSRHRGPMRIWWREPDKFRQELTTQGRTTTKILDGNAMWVVHPDGRVQRMHGTAEGAAAVAQLQEDRERMADLAQFITLGSLKGPGVHFSFDGEKKGSGSFAGDWVKVTRTAPGATTMHFWLAYERDAQGAYVGKWPGIIRVEGDPRQGVPTEDFILGSWVESRPDQRQAFRYPSVVEAFSRAPGAQALRFLKATVEEIKLNIGVPDERFGPPVR